MGFDFTAKASLRPMVILLPQLPKRWNFTSGLQLRVTELFPTSTPGHLVMEGVLVRDHMGRGNVVRTSCRHCALDYYAQESPILQRR